MGIEVTSSTTVKKSQKFGKINCCICGKEVGMMGRVQLSDMEEICRACAKLAGPFFIPLEATKDMYTEHIKNMEVYNKLYDAYFKKNKVAKKFGMGDGKIYVNEEAALICFTKKRGGFLMFGGTVYPMVYRLADVEAYDTIHKTIKDSEGKEVDAKYISFTFHNVTGVYAISMKSGGGSDNKLIKYLEKSMGLTGLKGMKNKFTAMKENAKAVSNIIGNVKDAMENPDNYNANAAAASAEADKMFYNGREALVEKADNAIASVLK